MNIHRERRAASIKQEQDMIKQEQENSNNLFWKLSIKHPSGMREDKAEDLSLRSDPQNKKITHRKDKKNIKGL